ncbi:hypothetical protein GCM10025876_17140 [Demequina litorisediminis]|uniref:LppM domain-containing protein n=1 Tax=Demequina litorisediminis TaxID=1849022 RepID=A0ABQ6ICQ5_9MICO|nr:hypothetical protein GCM10025876_17140 [Demequina litorisediminis]
MSLLGVSDDDLIEQMFGDVETSFPGGTITDYAEDDFIGKSVTFEDQPFSDLDFDTDELSITREGDEYVVEGALSAGEEAAGLGELPEDASMTLTLTFPGEVTDTNGTVDDSGRTVTWDLISGPETIEARGGATAGGSFPLWIVLVVGLALGVGAGVVLVLVTRRKNSLAQGDAPAGAPAAESAPGTSPAADAPAPFAPDAPLPTPQADDVAAPEGDAPVAEAPVADAARAADAPVADAPVDDATSAEGEDRPESR